MRIDPRENDNINEEWIHDKTRFGSVDGLRRQRLIRPLVRSTADDGQQWDETASNWRGALNHIMVALDEKRSNAASGELRVRGIVGPSVDLYSALAFSDYISMLGGKVESLGSCGGIFDSDIVRQFRFNTGIQGLEKADFVLLVGTDIIYDAPLLYLRMRKMFSKDEMKIMNIGQPLRFGFPIQQCGTTAGALIDVAEGRHEVCRMIGQAERPAIIVGSHVLQREDGLAIAGAIESIAENSGSLRQYDANGSLVWNGVNVVHNNANDCGLLELGLTKEFDPASFCDEKPDLLYFLGVNESELPVPLESLHGPNTFVVCQGSHGDSVASSADVVLPGASFLEKGGVYINFEGRGQRARNAVSPPVEAREDWQILRALSEVTGPHTLPYETDEELQSRLEKLLPYLESRDRVSPASSEIELFGSNFSKIAQAHAKGIIQNTPLRPKVYDYYTDGNILASSSPLMAKCSRELSPKTNFVGDDAFHGM